MSGFTIIHDGESMDLSDELPALATINERVVTYEADTDRTVWFHFLEMLEIDVVDDEVDEIIQEIEQAASNHI